MAGPSPGVTARPALDSRPLPVCHPPPGTVAAPLAPAFVAQPSRRPDPVGGGGAHRRARLGLGARPDRDAIAARRARAALRLFRRRAERVRPQARSAWNTLSAARVAGAVRHSL